jgi:hypothetical protein
MSNDDTDSVGGHPFGEFLRNRSHSISARGREAGFYRHASTSGAAREWVLREPLEEVLPHRYGVTSGEVRASDGSVSSQLDVLIYNRFDTPQLFSSFGAAVLPIEGVLAAISVKSRLDKAAIDDAADAAARLRSMPRRSLPSDPRSLGPKPAVFAFGFRGVALETLRQHVRDATEGPDSPRVLSGVCVLGTGLVVPVNADGNVAPEDIQGYRVAHAREGAWGILVAVLFSSLVMGPHAAPNLLSYIQAGKLLDNG